MARPRAVVFLLLCALAVHVLAWTKEDHEIFRLRDEVMAAEGEDATFYSFLGIPTAATVDEIIRVYRKRSKQLHPDKAVAAILAKRQAAKTKSSKGSQKGVHVSKGPSQKERKQVTKEATERYARLGVIRDVLKGPARERYDHFLKNGFPRWRGTGYYYTRFRPGLISVLFGLLLVFGGAGHYGAMYISWKRQRDFVERYIRHARRTAWGNETGIPGIPDVAGNGLNGTAAVPDDSMPDAGMTLNRRQKRMQEKESKKKEKNPAKSVRAKDISGPEDPEIISGPQGTKKKVIAENGKVLIVDSVGNVYLEEESAEGQSHEFLLDPEEIPKPTIFQTALFRLPVWAYHQTVGRALGKKSEQSILEGQELTMNPDDEQSEVLDTATSMNPNSETRKRKSKAKAR